LSNSFCRSTRLRIGIGKDTHKLQFDVPKPLLLSQFRGIIASSILYSSPGRFESFNTIEMIGVDKLSPMDPNFSLHGKRRQRYYPAAFTLVELLVTLAIIATLVAILLPAIQSARESARRATCVNHLHQLSIAALQHTVAHKIFPTGGWGHGWTGDPERGYFRGQPGGWVFNILPQIEEASLHDRGIGLAPAQKSAAAAEVISIALPAFNCPSRRPSRAYPVRVSSPFYNTDIPTLAGRTDYAANCGDDGQNILNDSGGPTSLDLANGYSWPNSQLYTGVCYVRSEVTPASITDGTSKTYLIGEKYLNPKLYETGDDASDRRHMYIGHGADTLRMATDFAPPRQDFPRSDHTLFGSAHANSFNMAFCDGSVRRISYDIDPVTHQRYGNRRDSEPINNSD
jgi:prepilin-type N-terminal cleavage/methylation domain-containing protein/prepilin-type processing-associated H-X9-DG protein